MSLSKELKPCPFCGGNPKAIIWTEMNAKCMRVVCQSCGTASESFLGNRHAELLAAWNRRALSDATPQEPPAGYVPLSDEDIQGVTTKAVKDGRVSWLGYKKDKDDRYVIPVLSPADRQFARAIEQAVLQRLQASPLAAQRATDK